MQVQLHYRFFETGDSSQSSWQLIHSLLYVEKCRRMLMFCVEMNDMYLFRRFEVPDLFSNFDYFVSQSL